MVRRLLTPLLLFAVALFAATPALAQNAPDEAAMAAYRARLDASFVMKDLKKYRRLPETLDRQRQFINDYPALLNQAAHTMLRVDGVDKRHKEKEIFNAFRERRSLLGLLGDAYHLWRATR